MTYRNASVSANDKKRTCLPASENRLIWINTEKPCGENTLGTARRESGLQFHSLPLLLIV
jgi:hypothetical protein